MSWPVNAAAGAGKERSHRAVPGLRLIRSPELDDDERTRKDMKDMKKQSKSDLIEAKGEWPGDPDTVQT
jgi:hypothetical protein